MSFLKWIRDRLKDLLYDSTNQHLDNGRTIAFGCFSLFADAVLWNMHLRKEINLAELGTGLAAILTALVIYVYKDRKNAV